MDNLPSLARFRSSPELIRERIRDLGIVLDDYLTTVAGRIVAHCPGYVSNRRLRLTLAERFRHSAHEFTAVPAPDKAADARAADLAISYALDVADAAAFMQTGSLPPHTRAAYFRPLWTSE